MLKKILAPLFVLALSACGHTNPPLQPVSSTDDVAVNHPVVSQPVVSPTKTLAGTNWSITVPASFTRLGNDGDDQGFNALDRTNRTTMFLEISEFPGTLDQAARHFAMQLANHGIDIQSMKPATWATYDGLTVVATKDTPKGPAHINSWATLTQGHVYNFGCIILPSDTTDVPAQQAVCAQAAASVKLIPLPTPAVEAPVTPAVSKPLKLSK